jgi:hypothetical protein
MNRKFKFRKSPIPYRFRTEKEEPSDLRLFQEYWHKKGYDLVNVTTLLEPKLGTSGSCGDLQDFDESIHHIQLWYRDECVVNMGPNKFNVIDDTKYVGFVTNLDDPMGADFAIFRKVKLE